ncbi:hypothetical protein JMG10_20190 [Nostoc ellipsosporum NOK]|nr:hypothetical protein [Nostoc ellipsosporum NOK]
MTKRIQTYDDLVEEKQRLKVLLKAQKELIHQDVQEIKAELEPIRSAISIAGKFFSRDTSNPLMNLGLNRVIDFVMKRVLLSKTGWFTKLAVPFIMKNYSSHFVEENKGKLFSWITSLFNKKKNSNGQHEEDEEDLEENNVPAGETTSDVRPTL